MGSKRSVPLWCCRREEYRPTNHSCYVCAQLSIVGHSRSIIMMGYALLAFTFVCSLTSLVLYLLHRQSTDVQQQNIKALQMLSMLFLLPALVALCYGIFIGAIWANISWGQYWSWDPKETWALITLMVYAVPVHFFYSKHQHAPLFYHIYMLLAFSTVLMTYFGVNYFLGGMHSYA